MYRGRYGGYGYGYGPGPGFGGRGWGRFPGAGFRRGGGFGRGWCGYWFPGVAPHPYFDAAPPWAVPYGAPGMVGPEADEGEWLKAEAMELRAEAEAIKNELAEIEKRLAEIERPEEK